jgi:hypothetical protein
MMSQISSPLPPGAIRPLKVALTILLVVVLAGCGGENQESAAEGGTGNGNESFTFFDIGATSKYSDATRRSLENKLGNDAISHRNMIKLDINDTGLLKRHFPELDDLNRRLNSRIGDRIDHDTVKLMYRYARKGGVPFDYVEIQFSDHSGHPLTIDIRFGEDRLGTIRRLKEKYGPPKLLEADREEGKILFWRKGPDYLLVNMTPDQFGDVEHRIVIYFTENLRDLIRAEQADRQRSGEPPSNSTRIPF